MTEARMAQQMGAQDRGVTMQIDFQTPKRDISLTQENGSYLGFEGDVYVARSGEAQRHHQTDPVFALSRFVSLPRAERMVAAMEAFGEGPNS